MSRQAALSIAAEQVTEPASRTAWSCSSRPSAVHSTITLPSRVRAEPSICLPARPATSCGRIGTSVPSVPRYIVEAEGSSGANTSRRSAAAISQPSASAVRSTRLAPTCTPASSASSWPAWAKLTRAAAAAVMRVTAGDRLVRAMPSAMSRGKKPPPQCPQW